jgi:2-oxoglutarate ferredoxin oxidoreductase subunit alpha
MIPLSFPYTIKITGRAGDGVICTGDMLLDAFSRYGFYGTSYREYPSNIQGGYSAVTIQISDKSSSAPINTIDCLFIRFLTAVEKEIYCCCQNAVLIFDSSQCTERELHSLLEKLNRSDIQLLAIPLKQPGNDPGSKKFYSSEVLGVIGRFLSIPLSFLGNAIQNRLKHKDLSNLQSNIEMVSWGYQIQQSMGVTLPLPQKKVSEHQLLDGNEAIAHGAVAAGCGFFASYPITPSTGIGNVLAKVLPRKGAVSYQAEDEIAAIGAAIGASFAGVKSMSATSGPGLSLMQEFLGYASMVELPLVIVDVQRPGPSTGAPAQFAQEDLFAAVFGSHGETSRIVLAPNSIGNCYFLTIEAFNCSEYFQCPVIILSDSALGLTKCTIQKPDNQNVKIINRSIASGEDKEHTDKKDALYNEYTSGGSADESEPIGYKRYQLESNMTPLPVPGCSPVSYRITGLEHDEYGIPTDCAEMRTAQHQRRMNKTNSIETEFPSLVEWDCVTDEVDFGMVAWGITVTVTRCVVDRLRSDGFRVAAVYPRLLFPVCKNSIDRLHSMTSLVIIPESNGYGQYARLLRMYTDVKPHSILSITGSPIHPEKLYEECASILRRCLKDAKFN